jgi:hypothetical protein
MAEDRGDRWRSVESETDPERMRVELPIRAQVDGPETVERFLVPEALSPAPARQRMRLRPLAAMTARL